MSQHDINIANQGFPAFRADLNSALAALVSNNSGASAPTATFANMSWYDTTTNIFKIRNEDNDAWISVFTLDQTTDAITAIGSVTLADVVSLTGTQTLTNKTLTTPKINVINEETLNAGVTIDSVLLKDNTVSSLKQILLGSTSGSVEVSTPAVAGTQTLTVPAASGTLMVSGNMPAFSAYQSSAQTVTANTTTKIQFNTEEFDTANCYDNATNYRFTPNVAGYYQVIVAMEPAVSQAYQYSYIYKNGSQVKRNSNGNSAGTGTTCTAIIYMNGSTDYLEGYTLLPTTSALAVTAQANYFQAALVRTA